MAKCMQCGGMKKATKMKSGGVKKMAAGGSTTNKLNNAKGFAKSPEGGGNQKLQIYGIPNAGMTGPNRNSQTETMKKGGSTSVINRAVKPGCRGGMVKDANGNCVPVRKAKKGGTMKDLSGDGKITRKDVLIGRGVIAKKAAGGPIIDKLKAKLAERKVTKAIKKSVKSSGKIVK
jgi:hypothetical protein